MIANFRRLLITHCILGLAAGFAYWGRPRAFGGHVGRPAFEYGYLVIFQTFLTVAPYLLSAYYACDSLAARDPKASWVFLACAVGVGSIADAFYLGLFPLRVAPLMVTVGVTIVLLVTARLCATIWRGEVLQWDRR